MQVLRLCRKDILLHHRTSQLKCVGSFAMIEKGKKMQFKHNLNIVEIILRSSQYSNLRRCKLFHCIFMWQTVLMSPKFEGSHSHKYSCSFFFFFMKNIHKTFIEQTRHRPSNLHVLPTHLGLRWRVAFAGENMCNAIRIACHTCVRRRTRHPPGRAKLISSFGLVFA